jgi:cell wall-associated NlpC family hydrolase
VSIGSDSALGGSAPKGLPVSRGLLIAALAVAAIVGIAAVVLIGRAHSTTVAATKASTKTPPAAPLRVAHTTVATSAKHVSATTAKHPPQSATATKSVTGGKGVAVAEVRDPEEAKSFPLPASTQHPSASTPSVAGEAAIAKGAASDAQIRKELGEEEHAKAQERAARHRVLTPVAGGFSVGGDGTIPIPQNVPEAVQRVIAGGNAIADFPYIWGGGHGSFVANGYDCSGSVSYALAAGGMLNAPLVSGELASWGAPGPGRWITIYANAGHTFMDVDGMWFDTAGRSGPYASRWLVSTPPLAGYAVRHPPGF